MYILLNFEFSPFEFFLKKFHQTYSKTMCKDPFLKS